MGNQKNKSKQLFLIKTVFILFLKKNNIYDRFLCGLSKTSFYKDVNSLDSLIKIKRTFKSIDRLIDSFGWASENRLHEKMLDWGYFQYKWEIFYSKNHHKLFED
jgi:hypothetical protein